MFSSAKALAFGGSVAAVRISNATHEKPRFGARRIAGAAGSLALMALTACGSPPVRDYGGAWTPVHRFPDAPTEISLAPAYIFYGSPLDSTLQSLLKRWAADNDLQLSYQLGADFTLHQPIAKIRTSDLQLAIGELNAIYAAQGILITREGKRIVVRNATVANDGSGLR